MGHDLAKLGDVQVLPLDRNPAAVYLASLRQTGREAVRSRLRKVAAMLGASGDGDAWQAVPWQLLRYQHVAAIIARLQEAGEAPATVNLALAALRGVARASFNLGHIKADDLARIQSVKRVRGERLPRGRSVSAGELGALMRACADGTPAGTRDAAIIGLLYAAGLRRAEVAALNADDYEPETGSVVVVGKGGKMRKVFVSNGAADALADWMALRGEESGPLFHPVNKGGQIGSDRIGPQAIYGMLKKRARNGAVKDLSPHDLRRSFVGDLLDAGADLATVQTLAGHASPGTTSRYDRRGDEVRKRAAGLLHLPYERPADGARA
jgi:site-specific recombinase XerC